MEEKGRDACRCIRPAGGNEGREWKDHVTLAAAASFVVVAVVGSDTV